ncbi:MAG TPA: hypothetical protein VIK14_16095 [Ignavibacteria bacterium]
MKKIVLLFFILVLTKDLFPQDFPDAKPNILTSWAVLQLLPSPTFFQDANNENARVQFGFKWHITPLSISFRPNKYVSPVQSFFIYPARRFSGSAEIFIDPELATSSFKYSNISIFGVSLGSRVILPLSGKGENLCFSLGGKYTLRKNFENDKNYYYGAEAGIYFFGGLMGFQYTQNFNTKTNYNINLYIKYF